MIVYADGVFDLFHSGHLKHLKKIKSLYSDSVLVIGVVSDAVAKSYKRQPIINEEDRVKMVAACQYVDRVVPNCPFKLDEEFIKQHQIDMVVHAFSDDADFEKQRECFEVPLRLNKFRRIDYHTEISTSKIINDWHTIWEKKGKETGGDLVLNGWENTDYDPDIAYGDIIERLDLQPTDRVLEIGCGSGYSSRYFNDKCDYYGIDYSKSLIEQNIMTNKTKVCVSEANSIPFHDGYFDKVFCCGVFEYFPNKDYLHQVLQEIERLTKSNSKIYLVGIRHKTHEKKLEKHKYDGVFKHTIYTPDDFTNYTQLPCLFGVEERFNMFRDKIGEK